MARQGRTRGILDAVNVANLMVSHLSAVEFDLLIVQHGTSGEFHRSMPCPCARLQTRTPDVSCATCRGLGRYYPKRMREPMMALDVSRTETRRLIAAGHLRSGSIQITFPTQVVPGFGDMWLPDEEEHVITETLWLQSTMQATDAALRPDRIGQDQVKPVLLPRKERLLYHSVCCVEDVSYKASNGEILSANPNEYHLDKTGRWTWRDGHGPPPGNAWSVRYRAPAAYVIHTSEPIYRSEADERMPHKCLAQALYTASHEDLVQ